MSGNKPEPYIQKRAVSIVDMLFEAKFFVDYLTRPDLQMIEDYIAFELQAGIDSSVKISKLMEKHRTHTNTQKIGE